MHKHEYEIKITYTETHSVYVEAEDEDAAIDLALDMYYGDKTEPRYADVEYSVEWSDEED